MVVHVGKRGRDMAGLVGYLYGPGKSDEHTNQRMIASSSGLAMAYQGALSRDEAHDLGRLIESSWRARVAPELAVVGAAQGGIPRDAVRPGAGDGDANGLTDFDAEHVYHLIVSLPPAEAWTDEQWETIAHDVVQGMGFTSGPDDEHECRWVAVHHGLSASGNDHMHIAVNLIRQDGRRAELPANDYAFANRVREQIEQQRDFVLPLHDRGERSSLPAFDKGEHQRAREHSAERGHEIPDRVMLQQVVRGAAAVSTTEAEWIGNVLRARPDVHLERGRREQPGTGRVVSYQVRLGEGQSFHASELARDLTLGKLRPGWAPNETAGSIEQADQFWRTGVLEKTTSTTAAGSLHERDVDHHVDQKLVDQELVDAEAHLRQWNDELENTPAHEVEQWHQATHTAAGTLALLGAGTPGPTGEDFTIGARELSRQACRPGVMAANSGGPSRGELAARHIHLALRATSPDQHRGWLAVMKQLNRTARAIHAAQEARGQMATARQTYANVVGLLEQTHAHTEAALDPERQRIQAIRSFTTEGRPKTNASTPDTAPVQEQKVRSLDGQDPLQAQRRAPDLDRRR